MHAAVNAWPLEGSCGALQELPGHVAGKLRFSAVCLPLCLVACSFWEDAGRGEDVGLLLPCRVGRGCNTPIRTGRMKKTHQFYEPSAKLDNAEIHWNRDASTTWVLGATGMPW